MTTVDYVDDNGERRRATGVAEHHSWGVTLRVDAHTWLHIGASKLRATLRHPDERSKA